MRRAKLQYYDYTYSEGVSVRFYLSVKTRACARLSTALPAMGWVWLRNTWKYCTLDGLHNAIANCGSVRQIKIPKHRHAFTRLVTSAHALSIERSRYNEQYRPRLPTNERLCRFCVLQVEDECHALLSCKGSATLLCLRSQFLQNIFGSDSNLRDSYLKLPSEEFLRTILFRHRTMTTMAKYVLVIHGTGNMVTDTTATGVTYGPVYSLFNHYPVYTQIKHLENRGARSAKSRLKKYCM